ncbi:PQQ-binding-like beta-propeller repeat protein [Prosthecobacter sp.]|uniref:WD40 domain-containing protein n=1 Tax=Prosthecobacter sp. TaxID=1965333 RepID=UPI003783A24C
MSLSVTLFGDSLRDAAKPWLEELGKSDRDRLQKLLNLSLTDKIRLSEALARLFPGEDTQTALANLTRLRNRLNEVGLPLSLSCKVDNKKKSPPEERALWFTGPDEAVLRATRFSQDATADIVGRPFVPSKGIATTRTALEEKKIFVRFFVSYARANKDLADDLIAELKSQFGCSKRYEVELWMDQDMHLGDRWHERIQTALQASGFGLLLIGPEFLNRKYIKEHELPHFMQDKKPILPVGLIKVDFEHQDLLGLEQRQIFRLPGKNDVARFYEEMSGTAKKREFVHQLFRAIQKRLDATYEARSPSDAGTPARNEEDETCELPAKLPAPPPDPDLQRFMPPPEETRHFQRPRGYMHHLAQREAIDPTRANLGDARDALNELEAWALREEGPPFFALLGEVGIGKTTTLKQFTRHLIEKRTQEPARYPLPIYIDLRDYIGDKSDTVPTIEELLTIVIQRSWRITDRKVTAADLLRLVREEGALIIFDGLDEKIVHLTQNRARDFIRTLWSVLPQAMLKSSAASSGKLLISCRSHYFRDVWSQNAMLTGEDREGIDRSQYPAFCLLPFDEAQIRGYLTSFLGDEKRGGEAFELIASIHNLRDLAERPYLLTLISSRLGELEALQMRGETVNAARLYDLVVRSWLGRDDGKHHLDPMHKRRLMEALAAALWRSGEKQWDVDRLEEWFDEFLHQNPAIASAYASKDRSLLKEDLRTATFVLRPDTEEKHFRFAHTSLQEYFLASHLSRALADQADAQWDMPMASLETLDFLGQILATNKSNTAIASLERILGGGCLNAAVLAFKYWLEAIKKGHSEPQPRYVNLAGANFDEWQIQGYSKGRLLNLCGSNLRGVQFNRARVEFVDVSDADLREAEARQALFLHVNATRSKLINVDVAGLQWRHGSLDYALTGGTALELAETLKVSTTGLPLPSTPRPMQGMSQPLTYSGHRNSINACAWNPRGTAVASASADGTIRLWDAANGRELLRINAHVLAIRCCIWSPDGSRLLSGSEDNTLKLWDATTGRELLCLNAHARAVRYCAWSPDGSRLLSGSADHTLKLWDATTGRELLCLNAHTRAVSCCAWSLDGSRLLSGSADNTLKLWDATTGKELLCLKAHTNVVSCCAWSPDRSRLLSGSADHTLKLWDATTGKELLRLNAHPNVVSCCAWSHDGSRLLSGSADNTLKLWDAATGRELLCLNAHARAVRCCAWSPDGSFLLSGSEDNTLKLWDATTGKELFTLYAYELAVRCCAWSPDGSRLLSGSTDNTLKLWDATTGRELLRLNAHMLAVRCCAWSPDGSRLLSGSADNTLKIWDGTTGKELLRFNAHVLAALCCAWSPDGSRLLSGSEDNTLRLWDTTGKELLCINAHTRDIRCCAFSPDGSRLLSCSTDHTLKVWDTNTGKELLHLNGHARDTLCCAWSPDGSRLLSGSDDNTLKLWDAATGSELLCLNAHARAVRCCAWSPDGSRLLSGSDDNTLKLWDATTGKELLCLNAHMRAVSCSAWSPDGSHLLSSSADNTLKLWDASSGQCLWTAHNLPENQSAVINGSSTEILHATPEAWRWLGWEERDAKGRFIRRLPAEAFGPIPGMED